MQKNASTILIAFLAGVIVAGGSAWVATSFRRESPPPPAKEAPASTQPAQRPAPDSRAPAVEPPAKGDDPAPPPQREEAPAVRRPSKPRPTVAKAQKPAPAREEQSAAPQPTQAETEQAAPAEQIAAAPPQPASPATPARPAEPLTPPSGTQTAPPPAREPKTVTLPPGTALNVRVNEKISTDTNYSGDTFTATLEQPIVVDGFVIADRGARLTGKVVSAEKAGRVKGMSELVLALTQLHTTDGQTVNIETSTFNKQGDSSRKRDAAEVAGGAALGAIIGAIAGGGKGAAIGAGAGGAAGTGAVLTTRGKAAVIPSETRLTFTLSNSVSLTEKLN